MKKVVILCAILILVLTAGAAVAADTIQGRLGVTGRVGFLAASDSEAFAIPSNLDTDIGLIGGGGFIYGISRNLALEVDVTNADFDADRGGSDAGNFNTTNVSLGAQYRFVDVSGKRVVPYLGAGVDILFNDFHFDNGDNADVDTVAGGHVSGGVDYFLMNQLALTAEVKGVVAPDADIKVFGEKIGNYDPTSVSMTFGVRYFFN